MFDRRKLDREIREIYLVHLLVSKRYLLFPIGFFWLILSLLLLAQNPLLGSLSSIGALFVLLLCTSFRWVVQLARTVSWLTGLFENKKTGT